MLDLDICSSFARNLRRKHQPKPSDCPDLLTADALPARRIHAQVGTIVRSEQSALFRHRNNAEYARWVGMSMTALTVCRLPSSVRGAEWAKTFNAAAARAAWMVGSWHRTDGTHCPWAP